MEFSEFNIGQEFQMDGRTFLCTDIGTRTVIAIRVDQVKVSDSSGESRVLDRAAAQAAGWFNGPPYAVAEFVFDEYDFEGCDPA